jgi:hypothetical protein
VPNGEFSSSQPVIKQKPAGDFYHDLGCFLLTFDTEQIQQQLIEDAQRKVRSDLMSRATLGFLLLATVTTAAHVHAAPVIVTATFQNGVDSYSDTFDRRISPTGSADGNGSAVDNFNLDGPTAAQSGNDARHGLLRFDNFSSALPAGAKVVSASVDMVTASVADAQSGGAFNLYRSTTAYDATSTWAAPFAGDGIAGDVSDILGSFDDLVQGAPTSARADKAVQAWINGDSNLGFGIRSDRTTDGWNVHTTGAATVANRPKLTVNYTVDPLVEVKAYQQGVNSYSGTVDLRLDSAGTTQDGSTVQETFLDGFNAANASADQSYLLRFDGLDLSGLASIFKAELIIKTGFSNGNADSPGPFTVHQMLQSWNTSSTYASFDSDSDPAVNGPQELQTAGTIGAPATTITDINDTEVMYIDVTSIVENWRAGQSNFGFYIGTAGPAGGGTDNGWQIFTTGATDVSFRPELRIIGENVPEPTAAMFLLVGGMLFGLSAARRTMR